MMLTYCGFTEAERFVFGAWTLVLCLLGVIGIVLSIFLKRYRYGVLALVTLIPSYVLWQISITDLSHKGMKQAEAVVRFIGDTFWEYWYIALVVLTAACVVPIWLCDRFAKSRITPMTIKRCVDEMNCGICYWLDNGHVVFSNDCINNISMALTGKLLMDGNAFMDVLSEDILPVGDRVWSFARKDIELEDMTVHELIATDITEINGKRETLRENNEKLSILKEELKAYGLKIDDIVRKQEVLQAKVNIHDEMNRLMLSTVSADIENAEEMDRIFSLWKKNALFLCMEEEGKKNENALKQLTELSKTLGITLDWDGELPKAFSDKRRELFYAAAQEAVTNAVKHANAQRMGIFFEENPDSIRCIFENDGNVLKGEAAFSGGLKNLSVLAGEQGVTVSTKAEETFKLFLDFPE